VNGEKRSSEAPPMKRLLDVLREDLHLTGTKEGCGEGECGSCSVRMNGELVNSCLVPVLQAEGAEIETVEGLGKAGEVASDSAGVPGMRRRAMRNLHSGNADGNCTIAGGKSASHDWRDSRRSGWKPLPLYRVQADLRLGGRGEWARWTRRLAARMRGNAEAHELIAPGSLAGVLELIGKRAGRVDADCRRH
jgi:hypothetical protein